MKVECINSINIIVNIIITILVFSLSQQKKMMKKKIHEYSEKKPTQQYTRYSTSRNASQGDAKNPKTKKATTAKEN